MTGGWAAEGDHDVAYWQAHLTKPVLFCDNARALLRAWEPSAVVECGPGQVLSSRASPRATVPS